MSRVLNWSEDELSSYYFEREIDLYSEKYLEKKLRLIVYKTPDGKIGAII